jgi:hypothetical protein
MAWATTILIFLIALVPTLMPADWQYPLRPDKINSAELRKYTALTGEMGKAVGETLDDLSDNGESFAFTRNYALSSLAAFYTPGNPEVTVLGGGSVHGRNHLLWFEPAEHLGQSAVFVTFGSAADEKGFLEERFGRWEVVRDSSSPGAGPISIIRCYSYNGNR